MRLNVGKSQANKLIPQLRGEASDIRKSRVPPVNASVKRVGPNKSETFSSREASLRGSVLRATVTGVAEVRLYPQTGNGDKPVFRKQMTVLGGCVIHTHTQTVVSRN